MHGPTAPSPDRTPDPVGLIATIREALRGSRIDYTTAPVGRAVIMLAVPMVMEMAMESIFAVADVFWVAHLGADAVATVGLTESMLTIIYTAAMGLSIGATALVARRTGEQDPEAPRSAAGQSIAARPAGRRGDRRIGGAAARRGCCALMGASRRRRSDPAAAFTRVMLGGNATVLLLFLLNAVFRGAGTPPSRCACCGSATCSTSCSARASSSASDRFPSWASPAPRSPPTSGRGTAVLYQLDAAVSRQRARAAGARGIFGSTSSLMRTRAQAVGIGHVPDPHRHGQLHRAGAHPVDLWQPGARRATPSASASSCLRCCRRSASATPRRRWSARISARSGPDRAERAVWTAAFYNMIFLGSVGLVFLVAAPLIAALFTSDPRSSRMRSAACAPSASASCSTRTAWC